MAVSRSRRMVVVLTLAQRAEEAAVEELKSSRDAVSNGEHQLQQIERYQREYTEQLNRKTVQLTARSMINDRQFLQQLGQARMAQEQQIMTLRQTEARSLRGWQSCYQRRQGIERLIQRLQSEEDASAEKLLQKELDELSSLLNQRSGLD